MPKKTLRYRDLPAKPEPGQMLRCPQCASEFSCTRNDYFLRPTQAKVICGQCRVPLDLVRMVVTYEPVEL